MPSKKNDFMYKHMVRAVYALSDTWVTRLNTADGPSLDEFGGERSEQGKRFWQMLKHPRRV